MKLETSGNNVTFISGQTGAGKTHFVIEKLVKHLKNLNSQSQSKIIVYALPNKDFVYRVEQDLKNKLSEEYNSNLVLKYVAGEKTTFILNDYLIHKMKKETGLKTDKEFVFPAVILTTHAYLKTRGDSQLLYSFQTDLMWLRKEQKMDLELYVDEGHLFFDGLSWNYKIYGKYEKQSDYGGSIIEKPVFRRDLSTLSPLASHEIQGRVVKHIYTYDRNSRNPKIMWDVTLKEGQSAFEFPDFRKNKPVFVKYLNFEYILIENPQFSFDLIKKIKCKIIMPKIKGDVLESVTKI